MRPSTFSDVLARRLRTDAAGPLVTFYDDATGERVELSGATYSNWVNKTAGLARDELDVGRGDVVLLDLPTHWLGTVWLGAAWTLGVCVTCDRGRADGAGLVVCGPDGVAGYAAANAGRHVAALSLRPLGGGFTDPLPPGVTDYGAAVLAQPDAFLADDPPVPDDEAWAAAGATWSQREMLAQAESDPPVEEHGRLLTDLNPCSDAGVRALLASLVGGAGLVLVANPEDGSWDRRYHEERATAQLRAARA
jgi:uncharacterized protein (TIGR03089 family)